MSKETIFKAAETCRPPRSSMQQRSMLNHQARVKPTPTRNQAVVGESSTCGALQSFNRVQDTAQEFVLQTPLSLSSPAHLLEPRADRDSRRTVDVKTFEEEFNLEDNSRDIFRVVSVDAEDDLMIPMYNARPSSPLGLKMRPQGFSARSTELILPSVSYLTTRLQSAVYFSQAPSTISPSSTPRAELPLTTLSPPALQTQEVREEDDCQAIPHNILLPIF